MKIAIVGCGGLGQVHASCYAKVPDVTVVGVCDIDADLAKALADKTGAPAYASFTEMLIETGCDVVSIALPSFLHKPFTVQAAEAGKHVICEKPIALNLQDAAEMIEVCEKNKVRLFVGHVVRFFPEYKSMKQKIDAGALGRIGVAHAKRAGGHPSEVRAWFGDDNKSGGVVVDLMVHDIDFMLWALGKVRSVYGFRKRDGLLDYASATLLFESGAVANIEAHWGYPGPFLTTAEISGSKGLLRSDSRKSKSLQVSKVATAENQGRVIEIPQSPGFENPYELEIRHFIDCIRDQHEPIVTAQDAYNALEIALAVLESDRTGQAVFLEQISGEELQ
ncbi:Gfo/Idh/MocA family protein [Paenibacillus eucommiae]|uniref:Dehydrogenase n=1 Tax=Paenibacillus eucommiae TaxID=1355755 RepID=A0ABS4J139_9BACL|nr:Gfo/Idh/MocA family oxidoreductase [Paenibacillus eucommiae]MBP1993530.1 putative dehydrogenase [Paenibacillus eucommiae]